MPEISKLQVVLDASQAKREMAGLATAAGVLKSKTGDLKKEMDQAEKETIEWAQAASKLKVAQGDLRGAIDTLRFAINGARNETAQLITAKTNLANLQNKLTAQTAQANAAFASQNALITGLSRNLLALVSAGALVKFGKDAVQTSIEFEKIRNVLELASGSAQFASEQFANLQRESNRIGIDFLKAANAFSRFQAAADGSGISTKNLERVFINVAEASRRFGLSSYEQERIFLALEQMISKGVVSMEELRRQLGNALPGAFRIAAEAMGMTQMEFRKLVESGELATKDFLIPFADRLHALVPAGKSADTTAAALDRLKNAWNSFKAAVGEQLPAKSGATALTQLLNAVTVPDNQLQAQIDRLMSKANELAARDGYNLLASPIDAQGIIQGFPTRIGDNQSSMYLEYARRIISKQDRAGSSQPSYNTFGGILTDAAFAGFDKFKDMMAAPNTEQIKTFQKEINKLQDQGYDGRQKIIESYQAEEDRIKTLKLTYGQLYGPGGVIQKLQAAKDRELQKYDQAKALEVESKEAKELNSVYEEMEKITASVYKDSLPDDYSKKIFEINEAFRQQLNLLIQLGERGADISGLYSQLAKNRDIAIASQRMPRQRGGYTGESFGGLMAGVRADERALLGPTTADEYTAISQRITDRSAEMARRLKADAVSVTEAWQYGAREAEKAFGSFAQRVATLSAGVTETLDRGLTDGLTSWITGTKTAEAAFSEMATAIVSDLTRIVIQQMLVRSLLSGFSGAGSVFGGGQSQYQQLGLQSSYPLQHWGSSEAAPHRGTIRMHTGGVAGDEKMAILKRSEAVFTDEQLAKLGSVMGGNQQPIQITNINVLDDDTVDKMLVRRSNTVVNIIGRQGKTVAALTGMGR